MRYNGKALARARDALDRIRKNNEELTATRRAAIFGHYPEIAELERELSRLIIGVSLDAISNRQDAAAAVDNARERSIIIENKISSLLIKAGFPSDYLRDSKSCIKCSDTGFVRGKICSCLEKLYEDELYKELSALPGSGSESFQRFDLNYYPAEEKNSSVSPRECMSAILDACKNYVDCFGRTKVNLLFQGGTGLGKTYLSLCIARAIALRGFTVVYETAVSALASFETQRFSRDVSETEYADLQVKKLSECDLLIIDDLGTEMPGVFSASAIYTLLNSRIITAKPMIVSTNLNYDELRRRYSPQIVSRLEGEFLNLRFIGDDIRGIKKNRGLS